MDDQELFADLAERLRVAYDRVAGLDVTEAEKFNVLRQLRVITEVSKRDMKSASKRLDVFVSQLAAMHPSQPEWP